MEVGSVKRLVSTMLSIVIVNFCLSQKNDYNFRYFPNEYVERIVECPYHITSKTNYLFFGDIRSVHVEQFYADGENHVDPITMYYDRDKSLAKKIVFESSDVFISTEFFPLQNALSSPRIKQSYRSNKGVIEVLSKCEIDSIQNLIILTRFSNSKIDEVDSIFYICNFWPVEIRTRGTNKSYCSIQKIAYLENGLIYKTAFQRNGTDIGYYYRIDQSNNIVYTYDIDISEFDNISQDFEDSLRIRQFTFNWLREKDFHMFYIDSHTIDFSHDEMKLTKVDNYATTITYFNEVLLPIKKTVFIKNNGHSIDTFYSYNENNDLMREERKHGNLILDNYSYTYVYDSMNNWVERKQYENGKLLFTTKRSIEYY